MKKLLEEHAAIEKKIYEYFGTSTNWYQLVDQTDVYWDSDGHTVHWSPEEADMTDSDREAMYSEDVRSHHKGEDFTLLHLNVSTGDKETAIFDNTNRRAYMDKF